MKYADNRNRIVNSMLAQAKRLPAGSSASTAILLGMLYPYQNGKYEGLEIDFSELFDLTEELFKRAADAGLYFDAPKHGNAIEELPYNLDFVVHPLQPKVVFDTILYSESTWFASRQKLVIEINSQKIHLSEYDFAGHETNATHQCIDEEWRELDDLIASCDFTQWDDQYEQPVLDGTTWTLRLIHETKIAKTVDGSNGYPDAWRIFSDLQNKCRTLCNMKKQHFNTEH